MESKTWMLPNLIAPKPVIFNQEVCDGCNRCVDICPRDILMPNPEEGKPPILLYPDECWYDGLCILECPFMEEGAIEFHHPLQRRVRWKRKSTGEHFRIGMPNPPSVTLHPPTGGWRTSD